MAAAESVILATARLELHAVRMSDAEFLCGLLNEPEFLSRVGDKGVRSPADARRYIADGPQADYERFGYGGYLVRERAGGAPVGICGLYRRRDLDHPDLGFALTAAATGRGYATEAGRGVIEHARDTLELPRLAALVDRHNGASLGVVRKLGFEQRGCYPKPDAEDDLLYFELELLRD